MEPVLVLTTLPDQGQAEKLAKKLLEERLVACVQISAPVQSLYRWKKKLESSTEVQVWLKTKNEHLDALFAKIQYLHPYEVPEILCIPVSMGLEAYLQWMAKETSI